MNGWVHARLGLLCDKIGSGATPRGGSSVYLKKGDYTFVRSQNIYNEGFHRQGLVFLDAQQANALSNVEVESGDVLLNITGDSVARACQIDDEILPARVNQHVAIIRPDPTVLAPKFLRYYLIAPLTQARLMSLAAVGATRNALTKGMIESFEIFYPSDITTQETISEYIGSFDDKINNCNRVIKILDDVLKTVFKSWFVDFAPTKAKAQALVKGEDAVLAAIGAIGGEACAGLDTLSCTTSEAIKKIATLFPDALEVSGEKPIPIGWELVRVEDLLELAYGKALKATDRTDGDVPVYGSGGITGRHDQSLVEGPAIIIGRKGTVGSLFWENNPFYPIDTVFYVIPKRAEISFIYYMLLGLGLPGMNTDGAVPGLNRNNVYRQQTIWPGKELATAFENFCAPIRSLISSNKDEINALAKLRNLVLPKLISGEIDLSCLSTSETT